MRSFTKMRSEVSLVSAGGGLNMRYNNPFLFALVSIPKLCAKEDST